MPKENAAKPVDIQICPQCMGSRIRRFCSMEGDMSGIIAILPVKYECLNCGCRGRIVIKATNKPAVKDAELKAEANEADQEEH